MGNAHLSIYPYQPLPTRDREVVITTANDGQFRALCAVLGIPEMAADERFARNADRTVNRAELHPMLVARLAEWTPTTSSSPSTGPACRVGRSTRWPRASRSPSGSASRPG